MSNAGEMTRGFSMKMPIIARQILFTALALLFLAGCHAPEVDAKEPDKEPEEIGLPTWPSKVPKGKIDFEKHVRPILIINCLECHNTKDAKDNGNFVLETKKLAMTTGTTPPALIPGKPDESLMLKVLTLEIAHPKSMPPAPDKIWGIRMEILRRWIKDGAEWPEDVRLVHPREIKEW